MSNQRRLLPSTSMLVAFEAAARTGSFTHAAKELHLTQGAVSRQVAALESQLDVLLFNRVRKTLQLTGEGRVYAQEVRTALNIIRNASLNLITNPLNASLNLAVLPTFGTRWLMPRLPEFLALHPDITVNFLTTLTAVDFQVENLHAAIHYGLDDFPDTESTFLMGEEVVPVCSSQLLGSRKITRPDQLKDLPLLHLSSRPDAWQNWFAANGMDDANLGGMAFEQFSIVAQAASAGLGVALLPRFLIQSELDRGELTIIMNVPLASDAGYYLVSPISKSGYAPIAAFRQWLLDIVDGV